MKENVRKSTPGVRRDLPDDIVLIESAGELSRLVGKFRSAGVRSIGLDLEAENNLHRYGIHLCLVQVFALGRCYIVDPLKVDDLLAIKMLFESADVEKTMYSAEEDIKLLKHTHGIGLKGVYDVQLAAKLLRMEQIGLDALVQNVLGINFKKKGGLQKSNWNRRPLSDKQIRYACDDIRYLLPLRAEMHGELEKYGLLEPFHEETARLEAKIFRKKSRPHMRLKRSRDLSALAQVRLKHLYAAREDIARRVDFPPFWVINNDTLVRLARRPPQTDRQWLEKASLPAKCRVHAHILLGAVAGAEREIADGR